MNNSQVEQATKELEQGDKPAARARLRELLLQEPDKEALWLLYARAARTREQAAYCLKRALELNPDNRTAQTWLQSLIKPGHEVEPFDAALPEGERVEAGSPVSRLETQAENGDNAGDDPISRRLDELFTESEFTPAAAPAFEENAAGWTWECDPQGRYLKVSEDVLIWLSISPEEFRGKPFASYRLVARSRKEVASILQAEAESAEMNVTFIRSNGDTLRCRLQINLSVDAEGKLLGWHGLTKIADKKQSLLEAEEYSEEADQRSEISEPIRLCPFLGFVGDPQTCYTYPHPANSCLRQAHPTSVKTTYQANYCLTKDYLKCRIFLGNFETGKDEAQTGTKKRWKPRFWPVK